MQIEKPSVYETAKSFWILIAFLAIIISIRLLFIHNLYENFISKPFIISNAIVLQSEFREKNGYEYQLLKLKNDDGLEYYTVSNNQESLVKKRVRIHLSLSNEITFLRYLGTPFIKSSISEILGSISKTPKDQVIEFIKSQHQNKELQSLFSSLYLATPLDASMRVSVTALGIAHIVALSGFNLSILWGVIYGLLWIIYAPLHKRYFPYRHTIADLGFIALMALGYYVWFVDFSPSLIRAYLMVLAGFVMMMLGMELVSFYFLATISMVLLVLFPKLIVSLSFWFSVAGVFYIFLILHYTKDLNQKIVGWLAIPFGVFALMQPVVHTFFGGVSLWQFASIPLEFVYLIYYPLMIPLHMLGYGDISDAGLLKLFSLPPKEIASSILPWWGLVVFISLSLASIANQKVFYLLLSVALGYTIYIFMFV